MPVYSLITLRVAAKKVGATLDVNDSGRTVNVNIDAPDGQTWNCADLHTLACWWHQGDKVGRQEAIADALERMAYGLSPCDDDCECCETE